MLFYDPVLVSLFDRQIWLELTYDVAHARRMATTPMPQSHYDNGLWPVSLTSCRTWRVGFISFIFERVLVMTELLLLQGRLRVRDDESPHYRRHAHERAGKFSNLQQSNTFLLVALN